MKYQKHQQVKILTPQGREVMGKVAMVKTDLEENHPFHRLEKDYLVKYIDLEGSIIEILLDEAELDAYQN